MPERGYKIRNQQGVHFITFAVVEWVDVFTRKEYKDILVESLNHCIIEKGLRVHCWVIMTNHLHFILSAKDGYSLSNILRDFKKFTSVKITDAVKNNKHESRRDWMLDIFKTSGKENSRNIVYQFWRQDNHPIELTDNKMIDQRLNYIHNNPVVECIVEKPEDYIYSSARDYAGIKGLINIELI